VITRARAIAAAADLLLVAFLVCLAFATAAEVRHNQAQGAHGHAPHDRPVAARTP
jgi:hypothetical protein